MLIRGADVQAAPRTPDQKLAMVQRIPVLTVLIGRLDTRMREHGGGGVLASPRDRFNSCRFCVDQNNMRRRLSRRARPQGHDEAGFTLIEVMVAVLMLTVGVVGLAAMFDTATGATFTNRARVGATNLGREVTDYARAMPYGTLSAASTPAALERAAGGTGPVGGWTVSRSGVTYTVSSSLCIVDDPKDGSYQSTLPSGYCVRPTPISATPDGEPNDAKRVTVTVQWTRGTLTRTSTETATLVPAGRADPAAVVSLVGTPASPIEDPLATSVSEVAVTSSPAAALDWAINGVPQGTASGSGTNWNFAWALPSSSLDGVYQVSAQSEDLLGNFGTPLVASVIVNRFAPLAPTGLFGGRDTMGGDLNGNGWVDLQWQPNAEGDIVGYIVRTAPSVSSGSAVCGSLASPAAATACTDTSPSGGTPTYYVAAVDRDPAGANRAGAFSPLTISAAPSPPGIPQTLSRTAGALTWAAPSTGTVFFYRVYRNCRSAPTCRIATTGLPSYTDPSYSAGDTYYVTAANGRSAPPPPADGWLAESKAVGPL